MALSNAYKNLDEIVIPIPEFVIKHDPSSFGQNHGFDDPLGVNWQYKGLDGAGQPVTDIVEFSQNAYGLFGGAYELNNVLPGLINASYKGIDTKFLLYDPIYVLYCLKKNGRGVKKYKWSRVPHLDGITQNRFTNLGVFDSGAVNAYNEREALWNVEYNSYIDANLSLGKLTPLNIQPKQYIHTVNGINGLGNPMPYGYGNDIFPISEQNWHNNDNNVGTQYGTTGDFKTFFKSGGSRYRMNAKKYLFKIAIEIIHPLDPTKRLSGPMSSNTLIFKPESGIFYDSSNSNQVDKYYYTWNVSVK